MCKGMNLLGGAIVLGTIAMSACTPETVDTLAPQGTLSAAACAARGNEIMLLVDTSARMAESSGYSQGSTVLTREQLVINALKRTLPHVKKEVDFGLITFPFVDHR